MLKNLSISKNVPLKMALKKGITDIKNRGAKKKNSSRVFVKVNDEATRDFFIKHESSFRVTLSQS